LIKTSDLILIYSSIVSVNFNSEVIFLENTNYSDLSMDYSTLPPGTNTINYNVINMEEITKQQNKKILDDLFIKEVQEYNYLKP